jgi:hypothetical protein
MKLKLNSPVIQCKESPYSYRIKELGHTTLQPPLNNVYVSPLITSDSMDHLPRDLKNYGKAIILLYSKVQVLLL